MMLRAFLSFALFAMLASSAGANENNWTSYQKAGQASTVEHNYAQAMNEYLQALKLISDNESQPNDMQLRSFMFNDISDCVENLSLTNQMENAKKLAREKLAVSTKKFGLKSGFTLDAMQDELFVYNQTQDKANASKRFWEYVQTARDMRSDGQGDLVEDAQSIRRERLQHKLNAAVAKLKAKLS